MSSKEREEIYDLQKQWVFMVLGLLFAFFFGIVINAIYDFLHQGMSDFVIAALFGVPAIVTADIFNYLFNNLHNEWKRPDEPTRSFLYRYLKMRAKSFIPRRLNNS